MEPLRTLFKDEVRAVGAQLGLPSGIVWRHPFPGPGLAIRIIGRSPGAARGLARGGCHRSSRADGRRSGPRHLAVPGGVLGRRSLSRVQGDGRTYGTPIVLRPVTSEDAMTADWGRSVRGAGKISTRITNEVDQINRVVLDITSKPPATIEWE
jgi:GMP synthase (glutamine-hydrolysing)